MKKIFINSEELYRLYITEKKPFYEICSYFNVSNPTLAKIIKEHNFPLRRGGNVSQTKNCNNIEKLKELASDKSKSNKDIANYFNISISLLNKWFNENDIERLSIRNNEGKKPSKEILLELYKFKSSNEIAKELSVSVPTIIKWLKSYNIKTRTIKETMNITLEKCSLTNSEKYGVPYTFQSPQIREKIKETNLSRLGVEYPTQSIEVRNKVKQTNLERYGVENTFGLVRSPSKGETELIGRLNELGFNLHSTRSILSNSFELDGYDEERKIAVEFCGLYWHSEKFKDKNYHYKKFDECRKLGIRLYTIFEDEWYHIPDKIISYIYMNNRTDKTIIPGRKTRCVHIDIKVAREFCKNHHIQNDNRASTHAFGLLYDGNIISVMTFGRHHRNSQDIVLNRFCSVQNTSVIGGASKLIKNASQFFKKDITTWSDNRFSNGNVYLKMGCEFSNELSPDYYWADFNNIIRYPKQSRKKSVTKQPKELTEKEYNESLGLLRIWDSGKIKWIYKYKEQ